jgi:hypothetical protein
MVDSADSLRISSHYLDCASSGHVGSAFVDAGLVRGGPHLAFHPDRVVLGDSSTKVLFLAHGVCGYLADPVVTAVEETGWYPLNAGGFRTTERIDQISDRWIGNSGREVSCIAFVVLTSGCSGNVFRQFG